MNEAMFKTEEPIVTIPYYGVFVAEFPDGDEEPEGEETDTDESDDELDEDDEDDDEWDQDETPAEEDTNDLKEIEVGDDIGEPDADMEFDKDDDN